MKVRIIVADNNTFGYSHDSENTFFQRLCVLAVSVLDGGDPLSLNGVRLFSKDRIRTATSADFDRFKVVEEGYRNSPQYIYDRQ